MIRAVFRVQCDGPCRGWLSYLRDISGRTSSDTEAAGFRGERSARVAAQRAGWMRMSPGSSGLWRCPTCAANPLDTPPMMSGLDVCATGYHMIVDDTGTCACQRGAKT